MNTSLTLTLVVFEFIRFLVSAIVACPCLTLTLVVFECNHVALVREGRAGLTLTLVVFECTVLHATKQSVKSLTLTLVVFESECKHLHFVQIRFV